MAILFELEHYNPDTAAVETLRLCTTPYRTAPGDTPASTPYIDAVVEGGVMSQHMFGEGATSGESESGSGELIVSNADGRFDGFRNHGFDLRSFTIKRTASETSPLSQAETLYVGVVETVEFTWDKMTFIIRDPLATFDRQAQTAVFAGDNTDEYGYEGTADDLEGNVKPFVEGTVRTISPPLVNTTSLLFIVSFDSAGEPEAVDQIINVKTGFNAITLDTTAAGSTAGDYATITALVDAQMAGSIASGQYATCLAKGAFCLNNIASVDVITCDVVKESSSAAMTCGQIIKTIAVDRGGISAGDFDSAALTAFDSVQSAVFGIYVDDDREFRECFDELLEGAGGYLVANSEGDFVLGRYEAPTGTPTATFKESDIIRASGGLEKISSSDDNAGIPFYKVVYNYKKFYRVFSESEFAGVVTPDERVKALEEYRSVSKEDTSIQTQFLSAGVFEVNSLMDDATAADTEASRVLALRKIQRDTWVFPVKIGPTDTLLSLGDEIRFDTTRFGYASGGNFTIIGFIYDMVRSRVAYYAVGGA